MKPTKNTEQQKKKAIKLKKQKIDAKIRKLNQKNLLLAKNIGGEMEFINEVNKALSQMFVIDRASYVQYKKNAKILAQHRARFNKVNSQYLHNQYKIKWYEIIRPDVDVPRTERKYLKGDWYYQYIQYIENVSADNKIFPYDAYHLWRLNNIIRHLAIEQNRLVYLRDLKYRAYTIAHKSSWRLRQYIKYLERKVHNLATKEQDILVSFVDRFHAKIVTKLEKSKKNRDALNAKQQQKELHDKLHEEYLKKLEGFKQQKVAYKKQYEDKLHHLENLQVLKRILPADYESQKASAYDWYQDQKLNLKRQKKIARNDYLNYSDFNNAKYAINLSGVVKYYNNKLIATKVLDKVNLKIKRGEFVVILGPSGSGKTTLLNIISGLDNASYGKVIVANENLIDYSQMELTQFRRVNIGYVFQQYGLLPNLTVRENIEIGQNLQFNKTRRLDIDEILKAIGIDQQANRYPNELSGGQQQRVSIARSVAKNPNILFGDEPTGAVDEKMSKEIMRLFIDFNKKYKTTIIIVTHNPILAQLATTVVNVGNGTISSVEHNAHPKSVDEINWSGVRLSKK